MGPELTSELTSESTRINLRIDLRIDLRNLPHASLLVRPRNPVSVIIPCKTVKSGSVENTVRIPRLGQMRSGSQESACLTGPVGYLTVPFACTLSTLRHFDSKVQGERQNGPLIPCERRLAISEI